MIELFENIPVSVKTQHSNFIDFALANFEIFTATKIILEYIKTCINSEEQNFIDFYFNLKMEQLKNEDHNDFSKKPTR